jgi:hypothetical protein
MQFSVRNEIGAGLAKFHTLQSRQFPFAVSLALNLTANEVKADLRKNMQSVFDRPRPYTLNSLRVIPSKKDNLVATVGFKDTLGAKGGSNGYTGKILQPEIQGGLRGLKSFETALRNVGVLPSNYWVVPGKTSVVPMDAYGNVKPSYIIQVLSALQAGGETGYASNRTAASSKRNRKLKEFFVIGPGDRRIAGLGLPMGIYQRISGGTLSRMVFAFVSRMRYDKRFDFYGVAQDSAKRNFRKNLKIAAQRALDSQR